MGSSHLFSIFFLWLLQSAYGRMYVCYSSVCWSSSVFFLHIAFLFHFFFFFFCLLPLDEETERGIRWLDCRNFAFGKWAKPGSPAFHPHCLFLWLSVPISGITNSDINRVSNKRWRVSSVILSFLKLFFWFYFVFPRESFQKISILALWHHAVAVDDSNRHTDRHTNTHTLTQSL